jgi:diguanylate cyclase (GGDEF)-like protein
MSRSLPRLPERHAWIDRSPFGPDSMGADAGVFLDGPRAALVAAAGLLFVWLAAWLDYRTGCRYSFSLFYLIPVAVCAWWGGFSCGILLALAGAGAWHAVDAWRDPTTSATIATWNGIVRFCTLTLVSSLVSRLHVGVRREHLLARTDALTGAANGRTFYAQVATEVERSRRSSRPMTIAYFDLDDFKKLNDRLGHAAGDAALRHVVHTARLHLRVTDLLARLGGDEFALLLPETGPEGAATVLARLHGLLSRELPQRGWPVTLSIGAVTYLQPPKDVDLMIQRADARMYAAKRKGKGRIEHEVVDNRSAAGEGGRCVERRATAVVLGLPARVRPEGEDGSSEEFATVRDLSAEEVRLHLDRQFAGGTLLMVDPLSPGPKTFLARVVRAAPQAGGWEHGCELATRLSEGELRGWLEEHPEVSCP